jgi:hypothetical protein
MPVQNGPQIIKPKGVDTNYSTVAVEASAVGYSDTWDLVDLSSFALEYQAACTGLPNVKLELQQSSDNINWYVPENLADIDSSLTDKNLHGKQLSPITMRYARIKVTELSTTTNDTVLTLKVSAQKRFEA